MNKKIAPTVVVKQHQSPKIVEESVPQNPLFSEVTGRVAIIVNSAQTAQRALRHAREASRYANAFHTTGSGIFRIFTGRFVTGGALTLSGLLEIYRAYNSVENQGPSIQALLDNVAGGAEMLNQLNEANRDSLRKVQGHLSTVRENLDKLNANLKAIDQIADHGVEAIRAQKEAARAHFIKAKAEFEATQVSLLESQKQMQEANAVLVNAIEHLNFINSLLTSTEGPIEARLERFIEGSQALQAMLEGAVGSLVKAQESSSVVSDGFQRIMSLHNKATELYFELEKTASAHLKLVKEQVQASQAAQAKLQAAQEQAQEELDFVILRSEEQAEIIQEMRAELDEARREVQSSYGILEVATAAVVAGMAPVSHPIIMGVAAAELMHRRVEVVQVVSVVGRGVGKYALGMNFEANQATSSFDLDYMKFTFDANSSGLIGRMRGQKSQTQGDLEITVAGETFRFRVNLNNQYALSKADISRLQSHMISAFRRNELSQGDAEAIIRALESQEIPGARKARAGFVPQSCVYFRDLQREMAKKSAA